MTVIKFSFWWLFFVLGSVRLSEVESDGLIDDIKCGVLYSQPNNMESAFVLNDFDQSVNTKRDYRTSIHGWENTGSIQVKENCMMTLCTGSYFEGTCNSLSTGHHEDLQFMANINSANCTCDRVCNCDNIHIPKNPRSCGRAYPKDACNKCHSEYLPLWFNEDKVLTIRSEYTDSIERIILRSGCNLTVWTELDRNGDKSVIIGGTATLPERIRSYQCVCDDAAFVPPERPASYPPLIELPKTKEQLIDQLSSNVTSAKHPGLLAAFESSKNGRNWRKAYILLIGHWHPDWLGLEGCSGERERIGECHFPVDLDSLGVSNTQVGVIYVNVAPDYLDKGQEHDTRWAVTLADYLSNHEDLKDAIPNAVILHQWPMNDPTIAEEGSKFQRKLKFLNSLRPLILDENYSNILFYMSALNDMSASEQRNPDETIRKFEEAINYGKWAFPGPIFLVPGSSNEHEDTLINGHWRMKNGEYIQRNIQESLKLISEKGGDPLGRAIFDVVFQLEMQPKSVMPMGTELLPENDAQVQSYQNSSSTFIDNLVKTKRQLQDKTKELITQFENRNTSQVNQITNQNSQAPEVGDAIKGPAGQNMEKRIEELENEVKRMQRLIDEEKLARQADMEAIQKGIWAKMKGVVDTFFD